MKCRLYVCVFTFIYFFLCKITYYDIFMIDGAHCLAGKRSVLTAGACLLPLWWLWKQMLLGCKPVLQAGVTRSCMPCSAAPDSGPSTTSNFGRACCTSGCSAFTPGVQMLCCVGFVLGKAISLLVFWELKRSSGFAHLVALIASDFKITLKKKKARQCKPFAIWSRNPPPPPYCSSSASYYSSRQVWGHAWSST